MLRFGIDDEWAIVVNVVVFASISTVSVVMLRFGSDDEWAIVVDIVVFAMSKVKFPYLKDYSALI